MFYVGNYLNGYDDVMMREMTPWLYRNLEVSEVFSSTFVVIVARTLFRSFNVDGH
jgi:hypothetical protein